MPYACTALSASVYLFIVCRAWAALLGSVLSSSAKCKLGQSSYGGSSVTVHFQLDGTCRCRWRDGSWTNGRWHERTETEEERGGPCELCEELREDEA